MAVVSELYAQTLFLAEDPIGRRVSFDWDMDGWQQIIGIVGDIGMKVVDVAPEPTIYVNYEQRPSTAFFGRRESNALRQRSLAFSGKGCAHSMPAGPEYDTHAQRRDRCGPGSRRLALQVIGAFA